ncbi:MAG: 50S ribosomal protein L6 [Armatimonadetes bacterium]|nr:50S ribosomal protein L6 [Armatimonadota bacterium]
MSRIGKAPVAIPAGVEVKVDGSRVWVKGPKGQLERAFHPDVQIRVADQTVLVARATDQRQHRALHGLTRALLANMVRGVTAGYRVDLEIQGVGYRAAKQGNALVLSVGYSHPVEIAAPEGIAFDVPAPTRIVVTGIDRERVGQVAARIRAVREPDPYKGKGIRYAGERIKLKPGKAGRATVTGKA